MKRKNRISKQKNKKKNHKVKPTLSARTLTRKPWVGRKKVFSPHPYIMMIAYYRANVFFTVADIYGQIRVWTSTGQSGFKNRDKTTYMAILRTTELFFKKAWAFGIRTIIFKFRNIYRRATKKDLKKTFHKLRKRYAFTYVGLFVEYTVAFNGCRKKKKRRK